MHDLNRMLYLVKFFKVVKTVEMKKISYRIGSTDQNGEKQSKTGKLRKLHQLTELVQLLNIVKQA